MKIIAGQLNGNFLRDHLLSSSDTVEWVKAAVAYANGDPELFKFCTDNSIPLEFWGRLDSGVPVTTNILKRFLTLGPNYRCALVYECFHPKLIWFGGYGVYIGSANLTS